MVFRPESSGPRAGLGQKLLGDIVETCRVAGALVLYPELEPARRPDAGDRRGRDRDHEPGLDVPRCGGDLHKHGFGVFLAGTLARGVALLEIFERHEKCRHVGLVLAVDKAVAVDDRPVCYRRITREQLVHKARSLEKCVSGWRHRA